MGFDPTGEYYPCIAAVPAYPYNTMHSLGHAADITFTEAWEKLGELRNDHLKGDWDKHEACRTCDLWARWDDMWERPVGSADGAKFSAGNER
jgi:radical SAM protein with 4Fe4S-binding SPASM domain